MSDMTVSNTPPEIRERVKRLTTHCNTYKGADTKSAVIQVAVTGLVFSVLCAAMLQGFAAHSWIYALLILPAAGLLVRLFIMQHDCGHGSLFRSRFANDIVGRAISVLTLTPYDFWRKAHNKHHSASGNLSRRGIGSIDTLTVREYQALPPRRRFAYRFYRNPFILLVLGTPLYIFIVQRFPLTQSLAFFEDYRTVPFSDAWRSILMLNIAIVVFYGLMILAFGMKPVLMVFVPVILITSWVGGWLFFIQHQFEDTYWNPDAQWNFQEAALLGSSYYVLPPVLRWFTGNIGLHHIHHLCALIPNYKLQSCLNGSRELQDMNRLTLRQSLQCVKWALWDEDNRKMVGFRDLKMA